VVVTHFFIIAGNIFMQYDGMRLGDADGAVCGPNEWLCASSQQCVAVDQVCDGVPHCANGADESANCSTYQTALILSFTLCCWPI